ncbi:MAG: hypothetical protein DRN07_02825 [Thermoplasmata archaeon]|nr:MAG: hypothetical protein DRN07_02825 [Thermoplasmata archaeon]
MVLIIEEKMVKPANPLSNLPVASFHRLPHIQWTVRKSLNPLVKMVLNDREGHGVGKGGNEGSVLR